MASLFEEYHKQAHEQSTQFGFEATCKTPVQPAQSNIEIKHITCIQPMPKYARSNSTRKLAIQ